MSECPCRDCKEREVGCHGYCELYKLWSKENEQRKEKIHREIQSNRIYEEDLHKKKRVKRI